MQRTNHFCRRYLAKPALAFGSLVLALVCVEIGLRVFLPQTIQTPQDIYATHPNCGYKLIGNLDRRFSEAEWDTHLATNSNGFRDREHAEIKPLGTYRIVGIGDSFLFGFGVESHETLLARLEHSVADYLPPGETLETINFGVPGHWVTQYREVLNTEAERYQPDLVVVLFFMNDFQKEYQLSEYHVDEQGYLLSLDEHGNPQREQFGFDSVRSFMSPLRSFLKRRSHAYIFCRSRLGTLLERAGLRAIEDADLYRKDRDFRTEYAYTLDVIRDMSNRCRERNTPFLLCILPEKQQVNLSYRRRSIAAHGLLEEEYDWLKPQSCLTEFCDREKIDCLDLTPSFAEHETDGGEPLYFEFDLHLTRAGHEFAARQLAAYLQRTSRLSGR